MKCLQHPCYASYFMFTYARAPGKFSPDVSLPVYLEEHHDHTKGGVQE